MPRLPISGVQPGFVHDCVFDPDRDGGIGSQVGRARLSHASVFARSSESARPPRLISLKSE
eukprot:11190095-Lingulodinium_polyedra.AAC.1